MRKPFRALFPLSAVAVLLAAVFLLPGLAAALGRLGGSLAETPYSFGQEAIRSRELDAQSEVIRGRILEKSRVTAEVVAGRLTLAEAAARFRDLDGGPPNPWALHDPTYLAPPDEDRAGLVVIAFVKVQLWGWPEQDTVVRRLQDQLHAAVPGVGR